jgi:hypothetical protein|tara:strand:- start:1204 stop:1848 length:645 start_codon:yes stop_codon:yes gene_type:complete
MTQSLTIPAIITYADEITSGVVNSYNSFASLDEADYYHARRLANNAYVAATESTRTSALYWATDILNRQVWIGAPEDADQKLAWPRSFVPSRNTINQGSRAGLYRSEVEKALNLTLYTQFLDNKTIPDFIKDATAELALYLIERGNSGATTVSQYDDQLSNLSLGGLSLQLRENTEYLTDMPYQVHRIVSDFLKSVKESDPAIRQVHSVSINRR